MEQQIPKKIYYCWFGGEKPQIVNERIKNWKEKLPDYEIVEVNDKNPEVFDVEKAIKDNLWFKTCYENKVWGVAIDYVRLKVLYENGGVYFDTDITVEKSLDDLLKKNKLTLSWEDKNRIGVGVVLCKKHDPNLKQMLEYLDKEIWENKEFTGPDVFTKVLKRNYKLNASDRITENDDILILPYDYFCPLPIGSKLKNDFVTENSYTIHWWDATWVKSNIVYFMKHKNSITLDQLIKKCFEKKIIIRNPFLTIEKLCQQYTVNFDFSYTFRFKYKYYGKNRFLTMIILGIQIPLLKTGGQR